MADLTITAANLIPAASAQIKHGFSAAAVAAGKSVFRNPDNNLIGLADNDSVDPDDHNAIGISLNATAAANQPISWISAGDLAMGTILTKGETYCVSGTAGGICPRADVTTGDELVILGVAKTTSTLAVGIRDTDITL